VTTQHVFHCTDDDGYNGIRFQPERVLSVSKPPGDHPKGVYFTNLGPATTNVAKRLRMPGRKIEFLFCFQGRLDLRPLPGGRGQFIFYSPGDYTVARDRQVCHGSRESALEALR
jgi:hypothetical protein